MLEELIKLEIPSVVFDPHFEMDFQLADKMVAPNGSEQSLNTTDKVCYVHIGKQVGISFVELSTRDVIDLLSAAGGHLTESMVNVIQMLHERRDSFVRLVTA